jgi:hypothetical protein
MQTKMTDTYIETIAKNLHVVLAELCDEDVPVAVASSYSGDPYSGSTTSERIAAARSRQGIALIVDFEFSLHELSGQCDRWVAAVTGGREPERLRFWELFHPRQYTGWWNDNIVPTFSWDGVKTDYPKS